MSQITPQMVKELREKTGAGMGDCKQALTDADGDMQAAIELLRKKGAASASKRADRAANEGLICIKVSEDHKKAVIVEINCETDFVSRNEQFDKYVNQVAETYLANNAENLEQILALKIGNDTIEGLHNEILAKFSEKIQIRRFEKAITEGYLTDYIHAGSKLGVLIVADIDKPMEESAIKIREIAMQIAAMNPMFINRTQVTKEVMDKEIEIYTELAVKEGKKPDIAERIAQGRLEKFYQEQCLIEQNFVKDGSKTVQDVLNEISKAEGKEVKIVSFTRFYLGEA